MTIDEFKAWRERMGFSQRAAAKALSVSWRAIQTWEQGRQPIRPQTAMACQWLESVVTKNVA